MANTELGYDIQTGRNVYVDKDLYESDGSYKARIDSYVNEGFALIFGTPDNPSSGDEGGGGGGRLTIWLSSSEGNKYQMYRDIHKETSMSIDELVQAANEGKTIVFQILGGSYAGAVGEFLYTPNISGVVTANLIVGFGSALQAKLLLFRITWDSYEKAMIARVAEVAYN